MLTQARARYVVQLRDDLGKQPGVFVLLGCEPIERGVDSHRRQVGFAQSARREVEFRARAESQDLGEEPAIDWSQNLSRPLFAGRN